MQFRKRPVVIEAWRFEGFGNRNFHSMPSWCAAVAQDRPATGSLFIKTLEGTMEALPGDWIIKGVKGEVYPCKPDIFIATYEPVD